MAGWEQEIRQHRAEKEEYLREHPQSPVAETETFDGLQYFAPDPAYRFELTLDEFADHEAVSVGTSTGGQRTYYRWGEFAFTVGGEDCTLTAYRADPDEQRLWIPFTDETNGDETYEVGRYLDLTGEDLTGSGDWVLDFNRAYNPYCAYSDAYECPLVPPENHLDVRIEAGEKAP
ncbi:MAG: DUF1684 domain-containing protein [Halobacteriaceae archaeon]